MEYIIHELTDDILLSPRVYQSWLAYCTVAAEDILKHAKNKSILLSKEDIGFEQFKVYGDGTAEIFVEIKKINKTISMKVPKEEYIIKK